MDDQNDSEGSAHGGEDPLWSELLFQHLPDPAILYDHTDFQTLAVNEAAIERYGYSREAFLQLKPWDVEHPFDREANLARIGERLSTGQFVYPATHRTASGALFPVELHGRPFQREGKQCIIVICRDVSDAEKRRVALEMAEARYRSVFERSVDLLAVFDLQALQFAEVNPAFTRVLGWRQDELCAMPLNQLVHPDHLSTVLDLVMNQLCQGKAIEHHENRFLRPDGSACWLRWTAQPSKELKVAYCVGQDVTGQKAAEQQKRDHENLLTDLIEVSSAPMMIHDHESRILALNSAFTDLLGYTVEDLPDLEAWERHAYPDPQYRSEMKRIREETFFRSKQEGPRQVFSPELRIACRDGSERVLVAGGGLSSGHVIIVFTDLTEIRRAQERLRLQAQRLALHLEQTPLAVVEFDLGFKIVAWNPSAEQIFGYTKDEAIGQRGTMIVPSESREAVDAGWHSLLKLEGGQRFQNSNLRKDGTIIQCEWYNTPLVDNAGKVFGIASLATDVTALRQHEADLVRAREESERANRAKSEFLSIMSHELRTPLNAIVGPCELLEDHLSEMQEGEADELLKIMHSSAHHLLDLINSVLDLAKIESGQVVPELTELPLVEFLRERMRPLMQAAQRKSLSFKIEHALSEGARLRTDRRLLIQMIFNLIGNSIKFTETGGVVLRAVPKPEGFLQFEIMDTGPGISPENLERIFEPFRQVDMSMNRRHEGAGLGLSICRRLAEVLGGEISVESVPGQGSTFRLKLPGFFETTPLARATEGRGGGRNGPEYALRIPGTVLIVEDEPSNQSIFRSFFKRIGVSCAFAETGEEAVECFSRKQYSIILMDIRLPGIDGIEAVRQIRALPGGDRVRIVAQSAFALAAQRNEFLASGMDYFLAKPITLQALRAALKAVTED